MLQRRVFRLETAIVEEPSDLRDPPGTPTGDEWEGGGAESAPTAAPEKEDGPGLGDIRIQGGGNDANDDGPASGADTEADVVTDDAVPKEGQEIVGPRPADHVSLSAAPKAPGNGAEGGCSEQANSAGSDITNPTSDHIEGGVDVSEEKGGRVGVAAAVSEGLDDSIRFAAGTLVGIKRGRLEGCGKCNVRPSTRNVEYVATR